MKDPAHHNDKTQRKVLREARQESSAEEQEREQPKSQPGAAGEEEAGVEIVEQRHVHRPPQRDSH